MSKLKTYLPTYYYQSIFEIPYHELSKQGINTLFFDLDNTIISYDTIELGIEEIELFEMLLLDFQVVIVSNSSSKRVSRAISSLNLKHVSPALKPLKHGFRVALKMSNSTPEQSIMIGDQVLTDVRGASKLKIKTILVNPIATRTENKFTRFNRRREVKIFRKIKQDFPNEYDEKLKEYYEK